MTLIKWAAKYKVNIEEIDDQHIKLVELVNNLYTALKDDGAKAILEGILTEMMDYAEYHFDAEETLFGLHLYPETMQHIQEHNIFKKTILALKEKHENEDYSTSVETMFTLRDWLTKHILEEDQKYVPFFNGNSAL
ncbi:MAG: bacteriohemerythrin [Candidatus Edwardsbacteria bacterium]|nr:bacteriohemerythrin [Candidatus Edwardsbacteria bacterium]MBU1576852.1 bacteriohemerythrin [Candidatus Edwardsbacteria bacterium]MBU2593379.1 bacteriohemerythrin [Candidatus Edwardsbacteria bacterium]